MKIEIENYIIKNYYSLLKICEKMTKNSSWAGDLLNDVLCQLYEKDEIKLDKLDDNSIKYYIVKCLSINWHSKTSPFYRKTKRESCLYDEISDVMVYVDDNDLFNKHKLLDIVEMEWTETDVLHKIIFEKYMILGSLKKVALDTNISLTSVHEYVNKTKDIIKANTIRKFENE